MSQGTTVTTIPDPLLPKKREGKMECNRFARQQFRGSCTILYSLKVGDVRTAVNEKGGR